tara:strand:+ start:22871 stop:24013 length:1143 start_codon:yes stop_codon:yes gene_type:complete
MSRTRYIGLPLLKENDTGNYASINESLTRLDVLSTLALESLTITEEPPELGLADAGKVWAVDQSQAPTGVFWETIQVDSFLVWGYAADATLVTNPFTQEAAFGDLRWYAIPIWEGAYAYDKSEGVFKTYVGGEWSRPTKRKVTSFTMTREAIDEYALADRWYTALTVSSPHRLVEVSCHVTYGLTQIKQDNEFRYPSTTWGMGYVSDIPGSFETQESEAGTPYKQPVLPFVLPKVALVAQRPTIDPTTVPQQADIVIQGRRASGADLSAAGPEWIIPGDNVYDGTYAEGDDDIFVNSYGAGNGPDGFALGAAARGMVSFLGGPSGTEELPSFRRGAEGVGYLCVNLSDLYAGSAQAYNGSLADENEIFHSITFQVTYVGG